MKNTLLAMLVCAFSSVAAAQVTVVRTGRLVDPDSGTVLIDQVIVIDGGKIQAVGKGLPIPAEAKVIDLCKMQKTPERRPSTLWFVLTGFNCNFDCPQCCVGLEAILRCAIRLRNLAFSVVE